MSNTFGMAVQLEEGIKMYILKTVLESRRTILSMKQGCKTRSEMIGSLMCTTPRTC